MSSAKYEVYTAFMVVNLLLAWQDMFSEPFVFAFPRVIVSLASVHVCNTGKEKDNLFSVQVLFVILLNKLRLVRTMTMWSRPDNSYITFFCVSWDPFLHTVLPISSNRITAHLRSFFYINKEIKWAKGYNCVNAKRHFRFQSATNTLLVDCT